MTIQNEPLANEEMPVVDEVAHINIRVEESNGTHIGKNKKIMN